MSNKEQRICKASANTITANRELCKRAFLVKMKNNANTMTKVATSLDLHRIQLLSKIATVYSNPSPTTSPTTTATVFTMVAASPSQKTPSGTAHRI